MVAKKRKTLNFKPRKNNGNHSTIFFKNASVLADNKEKLSVDNHDRLRTEGTWYFKIKNHGATDGF